MSPLCILSFDTHSFKKLHGDLDLTIGLDNVPRMSLGRFGLPGALRGSWISDNVFTFEWNELANINTWRVEIAFANDAAYLRMEETTGLGDSTIHAQAQP